MRFTRDWSSSTASPRNRCHSEPARSGGEEPAVFCARPSVGGEKQVPHRIFDSVRNDIASSEEIRRRSLFSGFLGTKKCGAESSDPNRYSQPRLPGSVVGEASMRSGRRGDKITKVSGLKVTVSFELRAMSREQSRQSRPQLVAHGSQLDARLLRRDQRMRDGMHRERNAILHAHFAHQLGHVRLYGALFNP
jgi:hypothetical protein